MKTQITWVEIICISNRKIISTQQLHPRVDKSGGNTVNRLVCSMTTRADTKQQEEPEKAPHNLKTNTLLGRHNLLHGG